MLTNENKNVDQYNELIMIINMSNSEVDKDVTNSNNVMKINWIYIENNKVKIIDEFITNKNNMKELSWDWEKLCPNQVVYCPLRAVLGHVLGLNICSAWNSFRICSGEKFIRRLSYNYNKLCKIRHGFLCYWYL